MKPSTKLVIGMAVLIAAVFAADKVYADAAPRQGIRTGNAVVSRLVALERSYAEGVHSLADWLEALGTNPDWLH